MDDALQSECFVWFVDVSEEESRRPLRADQ